MLLSEIFTTDRIKVELASKTKVELFHELVDFLDDTGAISDPQRVSDALWQRENVMNTMVAPRIALPHASLWLFKKTIGVFGISKEGIDYGTPDEEPVHIVMMLIDDRYEADKHLNILKQTARLVDTPNFQSRIMACEDPREVYDLVLEIEELQRL